MILWKQEILRIMDRYNDKKEILERNKFVKIICMKDEYNINKW